MSDRSLSHKLFTAAKEVIPGGVNSPVRAFRNVEGEPFFVSRARGSRIWDVDGNELIDYVGTWGPAILGHAPAVVLEAIHQAAKAGVSFGIPNPHEVEMARLIVDWVPSVEKVRMVNSGTEATMTPVMPPMMKMKKKPSTNKSGGERRGRPSQSVAIQQKICTPFGIAISMLEAVKKLAPSCGRSVVNMWWTQSPNARKPTAISDSTRAR